MVSQIRSAIISGVRTNSLSLASTLVITSPETASASGEPPRTGGGHWDASQRVTH